MKKIKLRFPQMLAIAEAPVDNMDSLIDKEFNNKETDIFIGFSDSVFTKYHKPFS